MLNCVFDPETDCKWTVHIQKNLMHNILYLKHENMMFTAQLSRNHVFPSSSETSMDFLWLICKLLLIILNMCLKPCRVAYNYLNECVQYPWMCLSHVSHQPCFTENVLDLKASGKMSKIRFHHNTLSTASFEPGHTLY